MSLFSVDRFICNRTISAALGIRPGAIKDFFIEALIDWLGYYVVVGFALRCPSHRNALLRLCGHWYAGNKP